MHNPSPRVEALLRSSVVWDNHGCLPLRADAGFLPQLERYRNAGVSLVSINVGFADMPAAEHLRMLSFMRGWIGERPDEYTLVSSVEQIRCCKADGRLGVVFDVEGMAPVQDDLALVQAFYDLGVRWMLIAYNHSNAAGGGCLDFDGGLTAIGRAVIAEMQRVGMVLCLSHTGARTAAEAIEVSSNPVIFSHSNPSGDTPHARNISDELIRACARTGGVVGLSGFGPFLGGTTDLVERLLRQIRYVMDLVGAEHVGLGLDYVFDRDELDEFLLANPGLFPPEISGKTALIEPESLDVIAEGLARDNLSDNQIRAVLGENWLRVANQVWR